MLCQKLAKAHALGQYAAIQYQGTLLRIHTANLADCGGLQIYLVKFLAAKTFRRGLGQKDFFGMTL